MLLYPKDFTSHPTVTFKYYYLISDFEREEKDEKKA